LNCDTHMHTMRSLPRGEPKVDRTQTQLSGYSDTTCRHCASRHTLSAAHTAPVLTRPPNHQVYFGKAPQTYVRAAASLARVIAVDGAKHGVRGGKSLPATGLAMSTIPALVKRPRFKTPRAHVCDHAPENTQNRAARCCCATHSRLTSPQRPFSSAYVPYLLISLIIASCFDGNTLCVRGCSFEMQKQ